MERGGRLAAKARGHRLAARPLQADRGHAGRLHRRDRGVPRRGLHARHAGAVGRRPARADPPLRRASAASRPVMTIDADASMPSRQPAGSAPPSDTTSSSHRSPAAWSRPSSTWPRLGAARACSTWRLGPATWPGGRSRAGRTSSASMCRTRCSRSRGVAYLRPASSAGTSRSCRSRTRRSTPSSATSRSSMWVGRSRSQQRRSAFSRTEAVSRSRRGTCPSMRGSWACSSTPLAAVGAAPPEDIPVGPNFFRFSDDDEFAALLRGASIEPVVVRTLEFTRRGPELGCAVGGTARRDCADARARPRPAGG